MDIEGAVKIPPIEQNLDFDYLTTVAAELQNGNLLPFYETVAQQQAKFSAIQQVSTEYPLILGANMIPIFDDPIAYVVGENNTKIASVTDVEVKNIRPIKVVAGFEVSMETDLKHRSDFIPRLISNLSRSVARQIDTAALLGRQVFDSKELIANTLDDVYHNSNKIQISDRKNAISAIEESAIILSESGYAPNGLVSTPFFNAAVLNSTDKDGRRLYNTGTVLGGNLGSTVGISNTVQTQHLTGRVNRANAGMTVNPDNVVAVIGDFTQAVFGIVDLAEWKFGKILYGDPFGNGDLQRRNQVAYRVEAGFGFGVVDPAAFITITMPGGAKSLKKAA